MEDYEKWLRENCFQAPPKECYELAKEAWKQQAQTIKELQEKLATANRDYKAMYALHNGIEKDNEALQAKIERLCTCNMFDLLAVRDETPAQSLTAIRNEVIEECARISPKLRGISEYCQGYNKCSNDFANAIRNLKTDPQLTEEE